MLRLFGATVRRLRVERRLTQQALAAATGLHRSYLTGIESGARNTSIGAIARILSAFDVSWAEFGLAMDQEADGHSPSSANPEASDSTRRRR